MDKISVTAAPGGQHWPAGEAARLDSHAPRFQRRLQLPRTQRRLRPGQYPNRRRRQAAQLRERDQAPARRLQRHRRRARCGSRPPRARRPRCRRAASPSTAVPIRKRIRCRKRATRLEFLRTMAHLRPRTNTFGAIARLRNLRQPLDPRFLPGTGLSLHSHADHHRQRLRRGAARCSRSPRSTWPSRRARMAKSTSATTSSARPLI